MNQVFEFGKIYEVNKEWKQYFDGFGDDCLGYYYVTPEDPNLRYEIQKCLVINKNKDVHPVFADAGIPFKFSDCKLCSLSSTVELKLFKLTRLEYYSCYDTIEAVVIATSEEKALKIKLDNWTENLSEIQVDYLGDYFGNLPANSIIITKEND